MEPQTVEPLMMILTQFGAAGLIGLLWILERRSASLRERQLQEAHDRLMLRDREVASLLQVVQDNTAAMKTMEHTLRRLIDDVHRSSAAERANVA